MINKNRRMILSNKSYDYISCQGDKEDYLIPEFDSEITDLDESEETENHIEEKELLKNVNHKKCEIGERFTIPGTNSLGKKISILVFSVDSVLQRGGPVRAIAEKHNIAFKIQKTECKLVRTILSSHGLHECSFSDNDYNLLWTGCHVRPFNLRTMTEYQKINHFPRSYELTRKDRLFKNVQRMQHIKGLKNFDFIPPSYLIPSEFQELCHNFTKDKGPYIVKPVALSRGRGIFLCNHPNQIPLDEQLIVSKYISNPYLIDGLKFDIRMYVLVTSYDPLVVYLYEEGLTRFATVKYHNGSKNLRTQCMHLTNYSVNKKNNSFVQNDDADIEDFGNKWSLGALLRYLKSKDIDTTCLMMKIEDIIIKSLISVESQISSSCKMFQTFRGNCFELYGYDIIIDENLRPWLLEVNLSPSLSCDSPLDFKIKSHMLSDMFNVIGVACQDPTSKNDGFMHYNNKSSKSAFRKASPSPNQRSSSNLSSFPSNLSIRRPTAGLHRKDIPSSVTQYKNEELRLVRRIKEESKRCGGWIRIFPTIESISTYYSFFHNGVSDQTNMNAFTSNQMNLNLFLHSRLYPERQNDSSISSLRTSANSSSIRSRLSLHNVNYSAALHKITVNQLLPSGQSFYDKICNNYTDTQMRAPFYERKLGEEVTTRDKHSKVTTHSSTNKVYHIETKRFDNSSEEDTRSSTSSDSVSEKELSANDSDFNEDSDNEENCSDKLQSSESNISKNVMSIENIIDCGGKLTKLQARHAFSSYLARVQCRLLQESQVDSTVSTINDENSRHEQLELVLRFLKRAASNMSPEQFTVSSVPERSLTLKFRQEWLAKLLGEFIRIYSRETQLAKNNKTDSYNDDVDNKSFLVFLKSASENDLEQTLSNYTKVNKSAGIFLNPNLSVKNTPQSPEYKPSYPPHGFHKSSSMTNLSTKEKELPESNVKSLKSFVQSSNHVLPISKESTSSYPSLNDNQNYNRPISATSWKPSTTKLGSNNTRPVTSSSVSSSVTYKRPSVQAKSETSYDPEAISKALQRLASEHRSRQLTASVTNLCDSDVEDSQSSKKPRDSLTKTLLRQYQQSKQLLQESRAKHSAILLQHNTDSTNHHPKQVLLNKPPLGSRPLQQTRLSCTMKK